MLDCGRQTRTVVSDDAETKAELFRVRMMSFIQWLCAWTWSLRVVGGGAVLVDDEDEEV